jgi:hypothetical protein
VARHVLHARRRRIGRIASKSTVALGKASTGLDRIFSLLRMVPAVLLGHTRMGAVENTSARRP